MPYRMRRDVEGVDLIQVIGGTLVDQLTSTARQHFFGVLEDAQHLAVQLIAHSREHLRRAQQHRRVHIMTTGVHHTRRARGVRQSRFLLNRQGVNIRAVADHTASAGVARCALDDTNYGRRSQPVRRDVPLIEQILNHVRGPVLPEAQLRILVQLATPCHRLFDRYFKAVRRQGVVSISHGS